MLEGLIYANEGAYEHVETLYRRELLLGTSLVVRHSTSASLEEALGIQIAAYGPFRREAKQDSIILW